MERKCIICGGLFWAKYSKTAFCSDACRAERQRQLSAAYIAKRREINKAKGYEEKYCVVCGKEYQPTSGKQKTCSEKCQKIEKSRYQVEWYRARKNEGEHYEKTEPKKLRKPKKKDSDLTADAVAARKNGLSYGKYKAREWMEVNGW
jgi:predicted nucleic acid-binding Zn ribbon protein